MSIVDLSARDHVGQVVVELRGELDIAGAASAAAELVAAASRERDIIVGLSALEFIDSSGVSARPGVPGQVRHDGEDMVLAAPAVMWSRTRTGAGGHFCQRRQAGGREHFGSRTTWPAVILGGAGFCRLRAARPGWALPTGSPGMAARYDG